MGLDVPHRRRARGGGARHRQLHLDRRALPAGRPDHRGDHHHRHARTDHGHALRHHSSTRISVRAEGARVSEIQIADVAMRFRTRRGEVRALEQISLTVPDGQFACIVGPSGCGKSTLLMIAAGLVTPTEGEVLVNGRLTLEPGADRGMVFQSYSLFPWLSVRRNIEFGPEIKKALPAERRKASSELIGLMRLDGFADAYPNALSGGMKQRSAIARA